MTRRERAERLQARSTAHAARLVRQGYPLDALRLLQAVADRALAIEAGR